MSKVLITLILIISSFSLGWWAKGKISSLFKDGSGYATTLREKPFEKYTIDNLSKTDISSGNFVVKDKLKDEKDFTSYLFEFGFNPNLDGKTLKKTTGQINIPKGTAPFPLILMLRGYVDQKLFKTGDGTRNASEYFAENGFITLAPDFLGYGGSDEESENIFETRFQTYTLVLSLLSSVDKIDSWNKKDVFLWGHSNGGQIALTTLEITGKLYPTTLWTPVSTPFPYSILFYTNQSEDRGKLVRRELAKFEEGTDPDLFSLDLYLDRINSPLQIHQGGKDDAVPVAWTDLLVAKLKDKGKNVSYYKYPSADHNLRPSWNTVVQRDLDFFKESKD